MDPCSSTKCSTDITMLHQCSKLHNGYIHVQICVGVTGWCNWFGDYFYKLTLKFSQCTGLVLLVDLVTVLQSPLRGRLLHAIHAVPQQQDHAFYFCRTIKARPYTVTVKIDLISHTSYENKHISFTPHDYKSWTHVLPPSVLYVIFHVCQVLSQLYTHTTVSD